MGNAPNTLVLNPSVAQPAILPDALGQRVELATSRPDTLKEESCQTLEPLKENLATQTANASVPAVEVVDRAVGGLPLHAGVQTAEKIVSPKREWFAYGNGNTHTVMDKHYMNSFNAKAPNDQVYPTVTLRQAQQQAVNGETRLPDAALPAAGLPSNHTTAPPLAGVSAPVYARPRYLEFAEPKSEILDDARVAKSIIASQAPSGYQTEYKREFLNWNLPIKSIASIASNAPVTAAEANETPLALVGDIQPAGVQSSFRQEQLNRRLNRLQVSPQSVDHIRFIQSENVLQNAQDVESGFLKELNRLEALRARQQRLLL